MGPAPTHLAARPCRAAPAGTNARAPRGRGLPAPGRPAASPGRGHPPDHRPDDRHPAPTLAGAQPGVMMPDWVMVDQLARTAFLNLTLIFTIRDTLDCGGMKCSPGMGV